jgi:hypothetical protein
MSEVFRRLGLLLKKVSLRRARRSREDALARGGGAGRRLPTLLVLVDECGTHPSMDRAATRRLPKAASGPAAACLTTLKQEHHAGWFLSIGGIAEAMAYSPDFSPIEVSFSKIKALPKKAAALARARFASNRSAEHSERSRADAKGWFAHCGCTLLGIKPHDHRRFGLRRTRNRGLRRTHLQILATAAAVNAGRIAHWLNGFPTVATRRSRLAALAIWSRDATVNKPIVSRQNLTLLRSLWMISSGQ